MSVDSTDILSRLFSFRFREVRDDQPRNEAAAQWAQADPQRDDLARLHQSLDMDFILNEFTGKMLGAIPFDGLEYTNREDEFYFLFGKHANNRCQYRLVYQGERLGEITLSRTERFGHDEIACIENWFAGLLLPLKNAIQYQRAMVMTLNDGLTGMKRASFFHELMAAELERLKRYQVPLATVMFDIDGFRQISAQFGRQTGDEVIRAVAGAIRGAVRQCDVTIRYNTDSFIVILPQIDRQQAKMAARRIQALCQMNLPAGQQTIPVSVCAGLVAADYGDSPRSMIDKLKSALFHAKMLGAGSFHMEQAGGFRGARRKVSDGFIEELFSSNDEVNHH